MHLSRTPLALVAVAMLGLAACGDDSPSADPTATLPPVASTPPTSPSTDAADYEVPTGADDVVISVVHEGGFVPVEMVFANTPAVLVTGDGRALSTGPVPAIYPGPLLPNLLQRSITPEAVQQLLAKADDLGLMAEVEYPRNDQIADAPDTVVTIAANGAIYRHRAYALGMDPTGAEQDPARAALAEFVAAATDLPATVGADALGPEEPFATDTYLIQARPADPVAAASDGIEPTVEPWPADAPVRLADAEDCAELPADVAEQLFADANTLTFFTDAGADDTEVAYQVTPVPQFPGRTC